MHWVWAMRAHSKEMTQGDLLFVYELMKIGSLHGLAFLLDEMEFIIAIYCVAVNLWCAVRVGVRRIDTSAPTLWEATKTLDYQRGLCCGVASACGTFAVGWCCHCVCARSQHGVVYFVP
jgi:hypothetical protein